MMVQPTHRRHTGIHFLKSLGRNLKGWAVLWMMVMGLMVSERGAGQISLTNAAPTNTQNFDGMNIALSLPTNWKMHVNTPTPTWPSATGLLTQEASSGSPSTGGTYNWGSTASERAAGAMTSGSFTSPNNLLAFFQNGGSTNIIGLTISYSAERYRINSAAASVQFFYSLNGSTWTAVTAGDIGAGSFPTGSNSYSFSSPTTVTVSGISVSSLSITPTSSFYLRWNINTTGSNSQGIGIDDVTVTATFVAVGTSILTTGPTTEPATISSLVNTLGASSINFDFDYMDDGATPATDAIATQISQIVFAQGIGNGVTDWTQAIAGAQLSDGTNTATATVNSTSLTFASLPNASGQIGYVADNATKTYSLKIWLKSSLGGTLPSTIDGKVIEFNIQNSGVTIASGSTLATGQSVSSGNAKNLVTVVATALNYTTQPAPTTINSFTNFNTQAVVKAQDANGNTDLDFTGNISSFSNTQGYSTTNNPSGSFVSGVYTFPANFQFTNGGVTPTNITFSAGGLNANSTTITVNPPAPEVNVQQSSTNYLTGSTYAYNNQVVGTNTDIIFTIQNTGTAVLNISSIIVAGTSFSLQGVAPTSVASGSTASFTVRFAPGGSITYSGTITIANDDADEGSYVVNLTGTGVGSSTSDIISAGNEYNSNIPYAVHAGTGTIAVTGDGFKVWSFTIRDGGGSNDADNYATKVSAITITKAASNSVTNWANTIRSAAIFDGTTLVKAIANVSSESIVFNTFTDINVPDNGSKTIDLYITFETSNIVDKQQFQFQILNTDVSVGSATSTFKAFTAPSSAIAGDLNRINVIASKIAFVQQPTNVGANSVISPTVTVEAVDANNNRDYDYTTSVNLAITSTTVCNTLGGSSSAVPSNGLANFSTLKVNVPETGITLTASSGAFSNITSSSFTVSGGSSSTVTLVGWNFADGNNIADVGITTNTSATISNNASGTPTNYTAQGQLASPDYCAVNDGWTSGAGNKAWTTSAFSTSGYSSLTFSSAHRGSNTGPRDFKVQYSINGGSTWVDVPSATFAITSNTGWPSASPINFSNLTLPSACDNQSSVRLRWIMTSNTAVDGGSIASGGSNAIDEIYVYGNLNTNATDLYYRSIQTGAFESACNWETSVNGVNSWIQAVGSPDYTSRTITIQSPHNITINTSVWVDELIVDNGATLTLSDVSLKFNNGSGTDMTVNGTFVDNSTSSNSAVFNIGATWALGSSATFIKTRNSSSSVYRDNYEAGMSLIPATANWIIRYTGAGDVGFTTVGGTYYPNLTFENSAASPYTFLTKFSGSTGYATVKGDLDIGGNTYVQPVTVTNENTNASPLLVIGKLTIRNGSTLTNVGSSMGTGFEVQGDITITGTLTLDGSGTQGLLKFSGSSGVQNFFRTGTANLYDVTIANTGTGSVKLNHDISVSHLLTLSNGIVTTAASPNGLLTLGTTAPAVAGVPGDAAYINGPLAKQFAVGATAEYLYPVGKPGGYPTAYNPCYVVPTNITGATTTFTSEYFAGPNEAQGAMGGNVLGITNKEYWNINKAPSGTSTARVKLFYDNPGSTNWIYYTSASAAPFYTNAIQPCWYCNVAVVHKEVNTWNFTKSSNFSATDPEYRYYANSGWIYSKAIDNFSPFTLAYSYNVILPVKLLSFTGRLVNADGKLEWSIADARDLDGFELEYSTDGMRYQSLAKIGSNGSVLYSFLHKSLPAGTHYYRLLVKEKGGHQYYSQVIMLTMDKLKTYVIGLAPTVAGAQLSTAIFSASAQKLQARITDVLGRQLWTGSKNLAPGSNQWNIDAHALPKGLYFISLETQDGLRETLRFIKD